jgi:hypothetical protein
MAKTVRTNDKSEALATYDVFTDATMATLLGKMVCDYKAKPSTAVATKPDGTSETFKLGFISSRAAIGWLMGRPAPAPKPVKEATAKPAKAAKPSTKVDAAEHARAA